MADRCYWIYHFRWALCHIWITIFFYGVGFEPVRMRRLSTLLGRRYIFDGRQVLLDISFQMGIMSYLDNYFLLWRGIRTRTDAATSPSTAMYGVSTDSATETSPKKEAQIAQIKTTAITVPSV